MSDAAPVPAPATTAVPAAKPAAPAAPVAAKPVTPVAPAAKATDVKPAEAAKPADAGKPGDPAKSDSPEMDAATLRRLATTSSENRALKAQVEKLTKELTETKTVAEKAAVVDGLTKQMAEFEEMAKTAPHLLLKKYGHTSAGAFWNEIVKAYTDDEPVQDPKVAELEKGFAELKAEREKEKKDADERQKKLDEDKVIGGQAERDAAVKEWTTTVVTAEPTKWPGLAKSATLRDSVAVKVLRDIGNMISERQKKEPTFKLSQADGEVMLRQGLDQHEKMIADEISPLLEAYRPAPVAKVEDDEWQPGGGLKVIDRATGKPLNIVGRSIDSSVRNPLDSATKKTPMQSGDRRIGMSK